MSENMAVLRTMMAASQRKDHDGFLETLTDDIEYVWRIGVRPIVGKTTMRKFLRNYEAGFDQKEWNITRWAEKDDVIFVEGVESLYDRARDVLIDNPFMQAIEFRNGKICKLRDYYDSNLVAAAERPAAESPP
jgi:ketosteroid isomerase-like protein